MPDDLPRRESAPASAPTKRKPLVPSGVLGMLMFVAVEAMFFAGLISAYLIVQSATAPSMWPPPHQPRLPIEATAVNSAVLLASGILFWVAARIFKKDRARSFVPFLISFLMGAFFVVFQGYEWQGLIREGLRIQSSTHGAFFYVIVGAHALHVIGALFGYGYIVRKLYRGKLQQNDVWTMQVLWTFVVGVWPIIYTLVYLT
jgi:cytochrome c oxidase subunit III